MWFGDDEDERLEPGPQINPQEGEWLPLDFSDRSGGKFYQH